MSRGTTVPAESSDSAQPDDSSLWRTTYWIGAATKALGTFMTGLVRYGPHNQGPSTITPSLDTLASGNGVQEQKTVEKYYRFNDRGRVLKRSLRQNECYIHSNGEQYLPPLVVERLKNEAASMAFIRENTDIPVPKLLDTYEEDGSYHLWMEYVDGVDMSKLTDQERSQIIPQGKNNFLGLFYHLDRALI